MNESEKLWDGFRVVEGGKKENSQDKKTIKSTGFVSSGETWKLEKALEQEGISGIKSKVLKFRNVILSDEDAEFIFFRIHGIVAGKKYVLDALNKKFPQLEGFFEKEFMN